MLHIVLPNEMEAPRRFQALREITAALTTLPSVTNAGAAQILPISGDGWNSGIRRGG